MKRRATNSKGLKLHLGCGSFVVPGWENVDKSWGVLLARVPGLRKALAGFRVLTPEQAVARFPKGIVRADVRGGLPYLNEAASVVYTSHMIEHMPRWQALELLAECRRVLEPGGAIRIATPDLRALIEEYAHGETRYGETPADSLMKQLETFRDEPGSVVQRLSRRLLTAPHQWVYDEQSLSLLLEEAGFTNVQRRGFLESDIEGIEALELRDESLFVEATNPSPSAQRPDGR